MKKPGRQMKVQMPHIKKPRIEMLPLIDIVFLVLVVFIYSMLSMSVHYGMPVLLPVSATVEPEKQLELSITVRDENTVFVDDLPVDPDDLTRILRDLTRDETDPGVLLFARKTVSYQTLFHVLDQVKLAGISNISLQAELER